MKALSVDTRLQIAKGSELGKGNAEIAREAGCSIGAVRKWRRRLKRDGQRVALLSTRSGRAQRGALSSFDTDFVDRLKYMREGHPGWGPKTLLAELRRDESLDGRNLPSRSSVARWLRAQAYVQRYQRHQALPDGERPAGVSRPHHLWELDARGQEYVPEVGVIQLININDVCSRAKVMSFPCLLSAPGGHKLVRRPCQADYQLVLRLAFSQWGLPEAVSLDHDPVFVDASSKSPFPMLLHLWLIGLGVRVHFIRTHCPTDHGQTERSHQTWYHQALQGQRYMTWSSLLSTLNERREFLNWHLPCAPLSEQPPLRAWPTAAHTGRDYGPTYEDRLFDMQRVYAFLSDPNARWLRDVRANGTVSLGDQVYLLGRAWRGHTVEIRLDPVDHHLIFLNPNIESPDNTQRRPIRNLEPDVLLGDIGPLFRVQPFQLPLPLDPNAIRVSHINETLGVMN
jgi:hypothetical protein